MGFMAPESNFFPAAMPNDGLFDLICIDGTISRITALQSLLAIDQGSHFNMPHVLYRKVLGYRIIPRAEKEGFISIDGEKVPFEPFQAEVHPGLGTVLSRRGLSYEIPGF
jgi:sphingosine kinase